MSWFIQICNKLFIEKNEEIILMKSNAHVDTITVEMLNNQDDLSDFHCM